MSAPEFISEDDLLTFDGWLRYQAGDPAAMSPQELEVWRDLYERARASAAAQGKIGGMKLRPMAPGEQRYAVAVREGKALWLTLWVRRNPKGEVFVMVPRGAEGWDPHASYHLDGALHAKSYRQKFVSMGKRQPLDGAFKGAETLGMFAGHAPKAEGAVCDPALFTGVVEVAPGWLGPRHGAVSVDLVEPGHEPLVTHFVGWKIYGREVFKEAVPWLVITVAGRP
jgi:hypothetical protein